MSCPDLSALGRAGTPRADPAVVEHIQSCQSCWVDWQIQQGARFLRDPQVKAAEDLDERIVAQVALVARHHDRPASWRRLAVTGLLVAAVIFLLLLIPSGVAGPIPVSRAVLLALAGGAATALYLRKRDETESGVVRKDASADSGVREGAAIDDRGDP